VQIDIGLKIAVSLADPRADVGTPVPQNPSADVNGVLGGEKQATGIRIPPTIIVLPATEGHIGTEPRPAGRVNYGCGVHWPA
jgi:hypothetical protein